MALRGELGFYRKLTGDIVDFFRIGLEMNAITLQRTTGKYFLDYSGQGNLQKHQDVFGFQN